LEHEARILAQHQRGEPVYILTENLCHPLVLSIHCRPTSPYYEVTVPGISSPILVDLDDFFLDVPSLVTAGISYANDAILRFNQLHKQHITLS